MGKDGGGYGSGFSGEETRYIYRDGNTNAIVDLRKSVEEMIDVERQVLIINDEQLDPNATINRAVIHALDRVLALIRRTE